MLPNFTLPIDPPDQMRPLIAPSGALTDVREPQVLSKPLNCP